MVRIFDVRTGETCSRPRELDSIFARLIQEGDTPYYDLEGTFIGRASYMGYWEPYTGVAVIHKSYWDLNPTMPKGDSSAI